MDFSWKEGGSLKGQQADGIKRRLEKRSGGSFEGFGHRKMQRRKS